MNNRQLQFFCLYWIRSSIPNTIARNARPNTWLLSQVEHLHLQPTKDIIIHNMRIYWLDRHFCAQKVTGLLYQSQDLLKFIKTLRRFWYFIEFRFTSLRWTWKEAVFSSNHFCLLDKRETSQNRWVTLKLLLHVSQKIIAESMEIFKIKIVTKFRKNRKMNRLCNGVCRLFYIVL